MPRPGHLLALAALCTAGAVAAAPVSQTVTITGFPYGYVAVDTSLTGVVAAGELGGTRVSGTTSYPLLTYCTEITQGSFLNTAYSDYEIVNNGTTYGFTATQAQRLGALYTLAGALVDTRDESAAFQLSVWEIMHEASTNPLNLLSGSFLVESIASQTPLTLASSWLNTISQPGALNSYDVQRLHSPTGQDYVLFNRVPEPAVGGLAVLALGLLALSRRGMRSRA